MAKVEITKCTNTPGTRIGPRGRDRTLAIKSRKTAESAFVKNVDKNHLCFYSLLLVGSKYDGP